MKTNIIPHTKLITALTFVLFLTADIAWSQTTPAEVPVTAEGTFTGKSGHKASGTVMVRQTPDGYVLEFGSDFRFDGAPDPKLAFGNDGYDAQTLFSELRKNRGTQTYQIPETLQPSTYTEVWIWCEQYEVPLALATISWADADAN